MNLCLNQNQNGSRIAPSINGMTNTILAEYSTCMNNYFVHREEILDNGESAIVLSDNEDDDDSDFDSPNKATSTKCHRTK